MIGWNPTSLSMASMISSSELGDNGILRDNITILQPVNEPSIFDQETTFSSSISDVREETGINVIQMDTSTLSFSQNKEGDIQASFYNVDQLRIIESRRKQSLGGVANQMGSSKFSSMENLNDEEGDDSSLERDEMRDENEDDDDEEKEKVLEKSQVKSNLVIFATQFSINPNLFSVLMSAGIVFDGGIVIDASFKTNDPSIFSVGPIAKFSRGFKSSKTQLALHNTHECGVMLASSLIGWLDPGRNDREMIVHPASDVLPSLKLPHSLSCIIPSSRGPTSSDHIFISTLPSLTFHPSISGKENDSNMEDESSRKEGDDEGIVPTQLYSRSEDGKSSALLELDQYGMVRKMAYSGHNPVEGRNLGRIVGWHESYLNQALTSFFQHKFFLFFIVKSL